MPAYGPWETKDVTSPAAGGSVVDVSPLPGNVNIDVVVNTLSLTATPPEQYARQTPLDYLLDGLNDVHRALKSIENAREQLAGWEKMVRSVVSEIADTMQGNEG